MHTKGENKELLILQEIDNILKSNDLNSVKSSIIINRIRSILGIKDLNAISDLYEALKAFESAFKDGIPVSGFANQMMIGEAIEKAKSAINKAEGK